MQGRISNIVPLFLITVLSIVAVEGLYQALDFFVFKTPVVSKKVRTQETAAVNTQKDSTKKKLDYNIILKRNLFGRPENSTASDNEPPAEEVLAQNKTELGIVLMGTISGSDNNNRAFILTKNTRDQELFSTGEVIEGALIKDIQRGKLVLSINGKDEVLDMSEAAEMRPKYKAPARSTKSPAQPATLGGNNSSSNINSTTVPRRRVVRRARATQNTPRSTSN